MWTNNGHSLSGLNFISEEATREAPLSEYDIDCEHCNIIAHYCLFEKWDLEAVRRILKL